MLKWFDGNRRHCYRNYHHCYHKIISALPRKRGEIIINIITVLDNERTFKVPMHEMM